MIERLTVPIPELERMGKYPENLFFVGNSALLKRPKVSIVGTRNPIPYTRQLTLELAQKLARSGICIVSGAAMGVDAIAHHGAQHNNTIAVMANGLDIRYPAINRLLIEGIEKEGLVISQFEAGFKAAPWSFVVRNEVVAALGDLLIVTQADLNSGSLRSVEFAQKMGKKIYVLPHRVGESEGTSRLLSEGKAEAIYDIDRFVEQFTYAHITEEEDDLLFFCRNKPAYEEAVQKFGDRIFAYELEGKITIESGHVFIN